MEFYKLLARSKFMEHRIIYIFPATSSTKKAYSTSTSCNEENKEYITNGVGIFWDLDNKPPNSVPPYDAANRLKELAAEFGILKTTVAYANRHAFTYVPDWVRTQRKQRKTLDFMEFRGIICPVEPYVCEVCGRKFETNIKFQKHFRQLHEREHYKRLARLESLKGKKKGYFKAKIGPKEDKYRAAAREVLLPKVGYGLAGELKRAGFCVRTVRDKPQAADIALKNDMMEAIEDGIRCLCLVSDDSDFVRVLKEARARNVWTIVVGDVYGDLKRSADADFSWREVAEGYAQMVMRSTRRLWNDGALKQAKWSYRPGAEKLQEEDDYEDLGTQYDDDSDDFWPEKYEDEGFNFRVKRCKDEVFQGKNEIVFASNEQRFHNQRNTKPSWKLQSDLDTS